MVALRISHYISARAWIPLLLLVVLSFVVLSKFGRIMPHVDGWAGKDTYQRVDFWIQSSGCTARTGAILAYCLPDGTPVPIEDRSLADDRGHTLLANVYALITGRPIDRKALTIGNVMLNAFGLLSVALALFYVGWKGAALLVLLFGHRLLIPGLLPGPDASAAYEAAFALAFTAVVLVAGVPLSSAGETIRRFVVVLVIATLALSVSTLLRQPYGMGGFLVACLVLTVRGLLPSGDPRRRRFGRTAIVLGCLTFATFFSTHALIAARSAVHGIPRGESILQHGISHNLYLGLGVPGNPWGINWSDQQGHAHASKLSPVPYASTGHYDNLLYLYLRTLLNDPVDVLKIYQDKLWESLRVISLYNESRLVRGTALFIVLFLALVFLKSGHSTEEDVLLLAALGMFGTVILQGVLALPEIMFINPGPFAAVCAFAVLVEAAGRSMMWQLRNRFAPAWST